MSLTLHTEPGNFRAFKILIAAQYNGVAVNVPEFKMGETNKTAEFLKKSPAGKVPVLETKAGSIFESNAIARYVARIRADTGLYGATLFESAQVDQWVDFCSHNLELPTSLWVYPVLGYMAHNAATAAKAKTDLAAGLQVLENHLADKTYLVGHAITLADIAIATTLVYPFKFTCDAAFRKSFPSVMRWFETCIHQNNFEAVIGKVVLAASEATTGSSTNVVQIKAGKNITKGGAKDDKKKAEKAAKKESKKEKAPAAKKEEKKVEKKEEEEAPAPKKVDHPFKILDTKEPSKFVMDAWKRAYSNCETYEAAMAEFWETIDLEGWSIFRGDYQYNEELKVMFMTSNLIGGFIQRTEEIRKWLFGTMTIRGVEGEGMKVTCYYLIRGQSIQPLIDCNDDAAFYNWTKMEGPVSEENKQLLFDYWVKDDVLEGEPCLDSRCYK